MPERLGRLGGDWKDQHGAPITVHGLTSSFRDWAAECTHDASDVIEMALAHAIGDAVRVAYQRGDLFAKRRLLMDERASSHHAAGRQRGDVPCRGGRLTVRKGMTTQEAALRYGGPAGLLRAARSGAVFGFGSSATPWSRARAAHDGVLGRPAGSGLGHRV